MLENNTRFYFWNNTTSSYECDNTTTHQLNVMTLNYNISTTVIMNICIQDQNTEKVTPQQQVQK